MTAWIDEKLTEPDFENGWVDVYLSQADSPLVLWDNAWFSLAEAKQLIMCIQEAINFVEAKP